MPLIVPAKFRQFVREFARAADPGSPVGRAVMAGVRGEVQARLKDQFRRGVGPDDATHKPTKSGKLALVSRKLGNAARARANGFTLAVEPKTPHVGDILDTHQDGHTFPARSGRVTQYRDKRGRLISYRKFVRRIRDSSMVARDYGSTRVQSYVKAFGTSGRARHVGARFLADRVKFGPRRLDPRPIRPVGSLTNPWAKALAAGVEAGVGKRVGRFAG